MAEIETLTDNLWAFIRESNSDSLTPNLAVGFLLYAYPLAFAAVLQWLYFLFGWNARIKDAARFSLRLSDKQQLE
jgi:hypothetical protein